jgi:hypothetical protein
MIGPAIGNVRNDDPALIERVSAQLPRIAVPPGTSPREAPGFPASDGRQIGPGVDVSGQCCASKPL